MGEYNGKINVSKDTMLFVVNDIFDNEIKESMTKENILKLMPKVYEKADEKQIIKMLPYGTYNALEKLIEYVKTSDDIKKFIYDKEHQDTRYLEEAMIVVMRAKYNDYNYSLNHGVMENLKGLFSKENKEVAKRYGEIEKLTIGMLYAYGVVDFEFLRKQLSKYMNEIITEAELNDLFFTRLNLNTFVNDYIIKWTNKNKVQVFVTYLNEEYCPIDIGEIAEEQKARNMRYKQFRKQEILKREEGFYDERAQKLYKFLKAKNPNLYEWPFKSLIKRSELGLNILGEISDMCRFDNEEELKIFMELYTEWYNNSPQYMLGGYSPIEFRKFYK